MSKKLPKEILVYQDESSDGVQYLVVTDNIYDIPEEHHGKQVGAYVLKTTNDLRIERKLI